MRAGSNDTTAPNGAGEPRVLLVTPRYLPHMGGVENHVREVSRRLAQRDVDVTVLTADPSGQLPLHDTDGGVPIRRVRAWPADSDLTFAPGLARVIRAGGWDVVHVQSYHTLVAPVAMRAALQAGIPYVLTFHGGGHSSRLRHALRAVQQAALRPLLAQAARLVAVAHFEVDLYGRRLQLGPEHFVVIPNGADLPPRSAKAPAVEGGLIASVGRLERYKGHQRILAALPYILARRPDARLWIAGAGPYEAALRAQAARLGVTEQVDIHAVPPGERGRMADELGRAGLVVLLSEYETHPIAVLEAVALGRPALVADTSGLSELARAGLAQAVPLHSAPQALAAAVLEALARPHVPPVVQLPSWDDTTGRLLALYRMVVHEAQEARCVS